MLNFVLGGRGCGKTYSTLKFLINRFKSKGEQFIYLRRSVVELNANKDTLFQAVKQDRCFVNDELKVKGSILTCNDSVMGYALALSTAFQIKSSSYPDVRFILFDEFLIEDRNTQYLPSEPTKLLALMETVGRLRSLCVIALGNFKTTSNVYFDYFNIHPRRGSKFTKDKDRPILIHLYTNEEYKAMKRQSAFGKLVDGTQYGAFMIDNLNIDDTDTFIEPLPGNCRYWFTIRYNDFYFGIYQSNDTLVYVSPKTDKNCKRVYALDAVDHAPDSMLLRNFKTNAQVNGLLIYYERGLCRFTSLTVKNRFYEMMTLV